MRFVETVAAKRHDVTPELVSLLVLHTLSSTSNKSLAEFRQFLDALCTADDPTQIVYERPIHLGNVAANPHNLLLVDDQTKRFWKEIIKRGFITFIFSTPPPYPLSCRTAVEWSRARDSDDCHDVVDGFDRDGFGDILDRLSVELEDACKVLFVKHGERCSVIKRHLEEMVAIELGELERVLEDRELGQPETINLQ